MRFSLLIRLMRFWPPFWGAGIRVKRFSADFKSIEVQMKLRFWNKNYVGTHFGGSLYSMTDPFYVLMLSKILGRKYIVWDKSASIRYKFPAKDTVYATFSLSTEQIDSMLAQLQEVKKIEPEFTVNIVDGEGKVVAVVNKMLHISLKSPL